MEYQGRGHETCSHRATAMPTGRLSSVERTCSWSQEPRLLKMLKRKKIYPPTQGTGLQGRGQENLSLGKRKSPTPEPYNKEPP